MSSAGAQIPRVETNKNVVHLIGYLGKNPEHKSVKTDRKYAVLSLATQRSWKTADEESHSPMSGIASLLYGIRPVFQSDPSVSGKTKQVFVFH
jgi:Single-strand binding protein family